MQLNGFNDSFAKRDLRPAFDDVGPTEISADMIGISFPSLNQSHSVYSTDKLNTTSLIKKNSQTIELVKYLAMSEYKYREDTALLQNSIIKHKLIDTIFNTYLCVKTYPLKKVALKLLKRSAMYQWKAKVGRRDNANSLVSAVHAMAKTLNRVKKQKMYAAFLAIKIRRVGYEAPTLRPTVIREYNRSTFKFGNRDQSRHITKPLGTITYFK